MFVKRRDVKMNRKMIVLLLSLIALYYISLYVLMFLIPTLSSPAAITIAVSGVFISLVLLLYGTVKIDQSVTFTEKVQVEKVFEVEVSPKDVLKAIILSEFYMVFAVLLTGILVISSIYDFYYPHGVLTGMFMGALWGNTVISSGKVLITDKGVVSQDYLIDWKKFRSYSVKDGYIILYTRLKHPKVVIPYSEDVMNSILSRLYTT